MRDVSKYKPMSSGPFHNEGVVDDIKIFDGKGNSIEFNFKDVERLLELVQDIKRAKKTLEVGDVINGWEVKGQGKSIPSGNGITQYWFCECACGQVKEYNASYLLSTQKKPPKCKLCIKNTPKKAREKKPYRELPEDLDAYMESLPAKSSQRDDLVCGVGINDAPFQTSKRINYHSYMHKAYATWSTMLQRCYLNTQKSYNNTEVCSKWFKFSEFYQWWKSNKIDGFDLDKDLFSGLCKIYSPETCCFLPEWINTALASIAKNEFGVFGLSKTKRKGYRLTIKSSDINIDNFYLTAEAFKEDWLNVILPEMKNREDWNILPQRTKEKLDTVFSYSDIFSKIH